MESLGLCFSCLKRKNDVPSSTFICADCVAMSSQRTSSIMTDRHLMRALRTLGLRYQLHEPIKPVIKL